MENLLFKINEGFLKRDKNCLYDTLLSFIELNKSNIRFQKHPLGFKYIKLGNISKKIEFRLHFWVDMDDKQDSDLLIHDHSFDFESFIVCGSLINKKYILEYDLNANGFLYEVVFDRQNSKLLLSENNQLLKLDKMEFINEGNFYSLKSNILHCTENQEKYSISLLKIIKPENKIAKVYSPKELNEIASFDRTFLNNTENSILLDKLIQLINIVKK